MASVGEDAGADGTCDGVAATGEGDGVCGWAAGDALGVGVALACVEMARATPGGVVLACKYRAPQTPSTTSTRTQATANMRRRPNIRFPS